MRPDVSLAEARFFAGFPTAIENSPVWAKNKRMSIDQGVDMSGFSLQILSRYDYQRHYHTYSSFSFTYAITLHYTPDTRSPLILRLNHRIKYFSPSNIVW
jgi:hypothetical protein